MILIAGDTAGVAFPAVRGGLPETGALMSVTLERRSSVCPHDCPSTCALEVEVLDGNRIGRVHGAAANS